MNSLLDKTAFRDRNPKQLSQFWMSLSPSNIRKIKKDLSAGLPETKRQTGIKSSNPLLSKHNRKFGIGKDRLDSEKGVSQTQIVLC